MYNTLSKLWGFVNSRFNDIMIFIIVALLIMLLFAIGYTAAKYHAKEPIVIESKI